MPRVLLLFTCAWDTKLLQSKVSQACFLLVLHSLIVPCHMSVSADLVLQSGRFALQRPLTTECSASCCGHSFRHTDSSFDRNLCTDPSALCESFVPHIAAAGTKIEVACSVLLCLMSLVRSG